MKPVAVSSLADIRARCIEIGDCWEWQGAVGGNGVPCVCLPTAYPKLPDSRSARVTVAALAWEAHTGKPAQGKVVWRTCCNQLCVNPKHLLTGTRAQMSADLVGQGVYRRKPSTIAAITNAKRKVAKLTIEKAREIRCSELSDAEIAPIYGIHRSLVLRIRRGEAWRETVGPASIFSMGVGA